MPDYTIGIAERIASLADSTATSNSVHQNDFTVTSQSVINVVNVALAPAAPTTLNPTPQTTVITTTDQGSIDAFGVNETDIVVTLLATEADGIALGQYMIRAVPAYWFSNLQVQLNSLTDTQKTTVANLEIGQQIAVTKTFPAGVVPQTVTEYLFVEGIDHEITVDSHTVTIYTGPASTYLQWLLGNYATTSTRTNLITNPSFELDTTGWTAGTGVTLARSTTSAYSGTASGLITLTNTVAFSGINNLSNRSAATAGLSYTASTYAKLDTGTAFTYSIVIYFYDAGGSILSATASTATTLGTSWERKTVTVTAPANTVTVGVQIRRNTALTGTATFYVDAIMIEQASSALSYFDGTYADAYTGYTLTYQAWDGTTDASTSTTVWGLNSSGTGSPLNDATYGLA